VHDFITLAADGFSPPKSGDVFGRAVEAGDLPLAIYRENSFADALQNRSQAAISPN
jgi:hypothetical protein